LEEIVKHVCEQGFLPHRRRLLHIPGVYLIIIALAFSCGLSCGKPEEKEQGGETGVLLPPVVNSVTIHPEKPRSTDRLRALVNPQSPAAGGYAYRWKKNGEEIMGEKEDILETGHFSKGDEIEVALTPYRDEMQGEEKVSEPVLIVNSPPVAASARLEPSPAYTEDDLRAVVDASDADGEYLRYSYLWKSNLETISGESGSTLSNAHFIKGDRISYRVSVSDGEAGGLTLTSNSLYIRNSPPLITSQSSGRVTEGFLYEYGVTARDPDGELLRFELSSAPEGMVIDSSTGLVTWEIGEEQREGSYEFTVVVRDPEGSTAMQPVTLSISY
jgi:hypothetical protein